MSLSIETQVAKYLKRLNISFDLIHNGIEVKESWGNQKVNSYKIFIGKFSYDFYQGLGCKGDPTPASVLYCLLSDIRLKDYSVQDYLDEFTGQDQGDLTLNEFADIEYLIGSCEDTAFKIEETFTDRQVETLDRLLQDY